MSKYDINHVSEVVFTSPDGDQEVRYVIRAENVYQRNRIFKELFDELTARWKGYPLFKIFEARKWRMIE